VPEPSDTRDTTLEESAKMFPGRLLAAVGLVVAIVACQVTPNSAEKSPPAVTITLMDKIGNQTAFSPPSTVNSKFVFSGNLDLVTVDPNLDIVITISATDSGGMKTLAGAISYYANCPSGGVSIPLTTVNETATNNPPNTVTNTLPFVYEVTTAQLKTAQSENCTGVPDGLGTVVMKVTATNQANLDTSLTEDMHTVGGVIPSAH
jgi:hypothetical protein